VERHWDIYFLINLMIKKIANPNKNTLETEIVTTKGPLVLFSSIGSSCLIYLVIFI
jgi:hypothetical protein